MSTPRWNTYLVAAGFHEQVAASLYIWNAAVGQSFHFPLQAAEVALRNVVNAALVAAFGANWWQDPDCRNLLGEESRKDIDRAVGRIRDRYRTEPHTEQIVGSLMFGFWSSTLKGEMNEKIWDKHVAIAFPYLASPETMRDVQSAARDILRLRNRIFHHEPLIRRNLLGDYGKILKLLKWICPHTRAWVRRHSSVDAVVRMRPR